MEALSASVGKGGVNRRADVLLVQRRLNLSLGLLTPLARLTEDGVSGLKTIRSIEEFQRRVVRLLLPDGRVDPNGKTWQSLVNGGRPARPPHVEAFIQSKLAAARRVKATWGVPVSVCLAQAALESSWGQVVKGNAYFGIKGKAPSGASTTFATTEVIGGQKVGTTDTFRAYKDFEGSADDYSRFLNTNPRYQGCFAFKHDPPGFADKLQQAGYATDPKYAEKLKAIMTTYDLLQYDR